MSADLVGLRKLETGMVDGEGAIILKHELRSLLDELEAVRAAPVAAGAVPDGYVLAPVDAALEMGWAYLDAARASDPGRDWAFSHNGYAAMIAAVPAIPAPLKPVAGDGKLPGTRDDFNLPRNARLDEMIDARIAAQPDAQQTGGK